MWARTEQYARIVAAALLLAAAAGCDQDFEGIGRADFDNPQDLTLVNGYLFVISSAEDELKVLDTNTYPFNWVKAPNPLSSLSIPLSIMSPLRVVSDVDFLAGSRQFSEPDGQGGSRQVEKDVDLEIRGPYVYAFNPAGSAISIIGSPALLQRQEDSEPRQLLHEGLHFREVGVINAPGSVTALVAQGPGCILVQAEKDHCSPLEGTATENRSESTVYFAAFANGGSQVYRVTVPVIPPTEDLTVPVPSAPELVLDLPGEVVTSLALVENPGPDENLDVQRLAVAVRANQGASGRTFLYDFASATSQALNFPGPVRQLVTSPGPQFGQAGLHVFGLLDESACSTGATECRGILAVETGTDVGVGQIAQEPGRGPMLPIRHGSANAVNFALFREGRVRRYQNGSFPAAPLTTRVPVLGVVAYATGRIGFFDAAEMRGIDGDAAVPFMLPQEYRDAQGTLLPNPGTFGVQPNDEMFSEGATISEEILVGYRTLTLSGVELDPAVPLSSTFQVDPALLAPCVPTGDSPPDFVNQCPRVRPGDTVLLVGACTAELAVTAVGTDSIETEPLPSGCSAATSFSVRAGVDRPLVVQGSATGFMGRASPGIPFRYYRPHFFRPAEAYGNLDDEDNPDTEANEDTDGPRFGGYSATRPALVFTVNPNPDIAIGSSYRFFVEDGVEPLFTFIPRTSVTRTRTFFTYPSGLAYIYESEGTVSAPIDSIMVSLPASRLVFEIYTAEIVPNQENYGGLYE